MGTYHNVCVILTKSLTLSPQAAHRLSVSGLSLSSVIPGQLVEARYEVLIPLGENTAHLWRQVVSNTFSSVIMEPRNLDSVSNSVIERRNSIATSKLVTGERQGRREAYKIPQGIAQGAINFDPAKQGTNVKNAIGKGVSYVIYWKCSEDFGQELFKVSLTIYQKDILQVFGFCFKEPTCEPGMRKTNIYRLEV